MSHLRIAFSTILLASTFSAAPAHAAVDCPLDSPRARTLLGRFIASPTYAAQRDSAGLTGVSADSARLLVDSADASTCQQISTTVTLPSDVPRSWVSYRLNNRFLLVSYIADGEIHLRPSYIVVMDSALAPLQVIQI